MASSCRKESSHSLPPNKTKGLSGLISELVTILLSETCAPARLARFWTKSRWLMSLWLPIYVTEGIHRFNGSTWSDGLRIVAVAGGLVSLVSKKTAFDEMFGARVVGLIDCLKWRNVGRGELFSRIRFPLDCERLVGIVFAWGRLLGYEPVSLGDRRFLVPSVHLGFFRISNV